MLKEKLYNIPENPWRYAGFLRPGTQQPKVLLFEEEDKPDRINLKMQVRCSLRILEFLYF